MVGNIKVIYEDTLDSIAKNTYGEDYTLTVKDNFLAKEMFIQGLVLGTEGNISGIIDFIRD